MKFAGVAATVFFVGLVVAGCGTTVSVTTLNPPPRKLLARDYRLVTVFSSGPPPDSHVDVALLEAAQSDGGGGTVVILRKLRERAAEMGCDAIVIGGRSERVAHSKYFYGGNTTLYATCVVYTYQ